MRRSRTAVLTLALVLATTTAVALPSLMAPLSPAGPGVSHIGLTMAADLALLHAEFPHLTRLSIVGGTEEGQPIVMLEVADFGALTGDETPIYVDGTVHGNEEIAGETLYWALRWLLFNHGSDERATRIVSSSHIHALPLVNADGNMDARRTNANLVDLNRNFPWMWCQQPGASPIPGNPTYCGPSPASESETQVMMAVVNASKAELAITMHSGTVELLYPWGFTTTPAPDYPMFHRLGQKFTAHTGMPASHALYPVTGAQRDWVYGNHGVPAFTYEVDYFQATSALVVMDPTWEVRLATAIEGTLWLFENARLMGARVHLDEAAADAGAVRLAFENPGWGDTTLAWSVTVQDAPIAGGASGVLYLDAESGAGVTWTPQTTGDGSGIVVLTAAYDRTKLFPRPLDFEVPLLVTVANGQVVAVAPA